MPKRTSQLSFHFAIFLEERIPSILLLLRRIFHGCPFRTIPLTKGLFAIVDPDDYHRLVNFNWHARKSAYTHYAVRYLTKGNVVSLPALSVPSAVEGSLLTVSELVVSKPVLSAVERVEPVELSKGPALSLSKGSNRGKTKIEYMHHIIIDIPEGLYCDHINHNGLDNRKANLRPATLAQNIRHRRKFKSPSRSKYKGLTWRKKEKAWHVRIYANGKRIFIGSFKDEFAAAHAYDSAAKHYYGDFATLNFPNSQ